MDLYAEAQAYCHARQAGAEAGTGATEGIDAAAERHLQLSWEEVLAACNASIRLLALLAQATRPGCTKAEADACFKAYFPWPASLHILHSVVDEAADLAAGRFNQTGHYSDAVVLLLPGGGRGEVVIAGPSPAAGAGSGVRVSRARCLFNTNIL